MRKVLLNEDYLEVPCSGLSQLSIMATVQQLEEKFLLYKRHLDSGPNLLRQIRENQGFKVLMSPG